MKVDAECVACRATGVYTGFMEAKGTAVECLACRGTGSVEMHYTPFSRRKRKRGIRSVSRSRGRLIATGCGPDESTSEPYEDWFRRTE